MCPNITIQIPFNLARYAVWQRQLVSKYQTNQVIKALGTWLVLKADSRPSIIQNWNAQKKDLVALCKCSETILRHRLKVLQDLQLIKYDRHNIKLCSWKELERILKTECNEKFTVQYNINDKQQPHDWIIAAEILDNQRRQDFMISKSLNKNPDLKVAVIAELIRSGADTNRLHDLQYFLSQLRIAYINDFVQASEIHHILTEIRPDNNRGVKGIASAWKARHPQTVSYWKRKLKDAGIIDVTKLEIESEARVRNKHCHVIWLDTPNMRKKWPSRVKRQTMLVFCDQLFVMQPWLIQNLMAA